jgi:hypothetical protein
MLCSGAFAQITLPVTDNFPSGGAEQVWEDYDSSYEVIESFSPSAPSGDGYVMNVTDGSGWQVITLTNDDGSLGNYKITAYIYVTADTSGWSRYGIFGRATSRNWDCGMYYLFCDSDGDDYLRCGYYSDGHGEWTQFIEPPGSITRDAWHKFELTLAGTSIIAEIDDVEVANTTDSTYTTGWMGICCYQNGGCISTTLCDRITIEALAEVESWTLY